MGKEIDLDFFARDYDFILVDTCALQSINLKCNENNELDIDFRKIIQKDEFMFLDFLKKKKENSSNFYFTPSIPSEINLKSHRFNYKKIIKRVNKLENYDTELLRLIRDNKKLRRLITDDSLGNILQLDSMEIKLYKTISDEYPYLPLKGESNISPVDYDFLINGAVLFCTRGSTALLSNDIGIFWAMKELSCRNIKNRKFDFFLRKNFPYVERLS